MIIIITYQLHNKYIIYNKYKYLLLRYYDNYDNHGNYDNNVFHANPFFIPVTSASGFPGKESVQTGASLEGRLLMCTIFIDN